MSPAGRPPSPRASSGPEAVTPARRAAYAVVRRVLTEGAWADRALHGEARDLEPRERALAKRLAFGTVQRRLTLDHVIDARTKGRLEPGVRAALQLGLFQLLFLDRVAEHAAIAEAVELAKPSPGHRVVNAVLRRVQREGVALPDDTTIRGAAVHHSHPEWLVALWWDALGAETTRALLAADNEPGELALRVNTLVDFDLSDIPGRREGETIVVDGPFDALAHPGYGAGAFTPQSRASQRVARVVDPQPGERVLDLCAAPGGKTTHLAALMGGAGEVVAVERHPGRARALRATAARMHAGSVRVVTADAKAFTDEAAFDRVLLDPPCSGLGTLQSHPDLRWRMTPAGIAQLAEEQDALLHAARRALRPGGVLVYSVCTISPAEERLRVPEPIRTWPHSDRTDGFYIARHGG
ncbi:MAG: rRNA (cytosine967-C5)-methyltransferase [Solirubrobacteraceae bacterium]|nr:rRNA (cytosine967-C5)-methyltransferase [Solirubrobacteraceae bacterium]